MDKNFFEGELGRKVHECGGQIAGSSLIDHLRGETHARDLDLIFYRPQGLWHFDQYLAARGALLVRARNFQSRRYQLDTVGLDCWVGESWYCNFARPYLLTWSAKGVGWSPFYLRAPRYGNVRADGLQALLDDIAIGRLRLLPGAKFWTYHKQITAYLRRGWKLLDTQHVPANIWDQFNLAQSVDNSSTTDSSTLEIETS